MMFLCAAVLAMGQVETEQAPWPETAFFGLHYDLHPNAADTELGRETTYEHIRAELEKVMPDYVQYDCKGHPGYAGYPTEIGSPSPGIVNDALRIWRDVTRDMGIPLSVHFSGVWDTRAIELHPEWARIDADGNAHANYTDLLSDYTRQLLIPQLVEVVTKYDLDGVWVDGENWATHPSWSERTKAAFTEQTGITEIPKKAGDPDWHQWLEFQRGLFADHVKEYADALHAAKPDVAVCSNWMYSVRQPEPITAPVDYLSGDFDPSFGADRAAAEGRFLSQRGLPWNLMAWSFLRTGDQGWTAKTTPHLCQEVSEVLAQGGSVFIYDNPQRSGRLTGWHQDILAEVAQFCRARKAYSFRTETIPQIAVLHSQSFYYRHNAPLFNFATANHPMEGALHALLECGYSVDIINEDIFIERGDQYPVVVVPEQEGMPEKIVTALKKYVENGGRLLVSGAHVAGELEELAGVSAREGQQDASYVAAGNGAVLVNGPWQQAALTTAESLAPLLHQQEAERHAYDTPSATRNILGNGVVVAVHGPVFRAYYQAHYPALRGYIGDMIAALGAELIHADAPPSVEMSARRKEGKLLIQFVNRDASPSLSPSRHMVEHVPASGPFSVTIPCPEKPRRCYLAPDVEGLDWAWSEGTIEARIADLQIHNVLIVE